MIHLRESILGMSGQASIFAAADEWSSVVKFVDEVHDEVMKKYNDSGIEIISTSTKPLWGHDFSKYSLTPMNSLETRRLYHKIRAEIYNVLSNLVSRFIRNHNQKIILMENDSDSSISIFINDTKKSSMIYSIVTSTSKSVPYIYKRIF